MQKKALVLINTLIILSIALSGCNFLNTDLKASEREGKNPTVIRVIGCVGIMDEVVAEITEMCEKNGIKVEYESYDWNTYDGKQKMAMTSMGGGYDVMLLPGNYIPNWVKSHAIVPVDDFLKENKFDTTDYYSSVKQFVEVDGKYYGVPFLAETMIYYYRTDLFEKAGLTPPRTIDEMYATAKKLTKDGIYGIVYPGGPEESACSFWSYFLWSYGGTYFAADWKPQINSQEGIESAEMFARILKECAPEAAISWSNEETASAFASGKVASMIMWPSFYSYLTDKEKSKVWDKIGVAPVPAGPIDKAVSRFGTWAACITADSKNVDAAEVFIKYFCGDSGLKVVARATSLPLKKYNNDKEIQSKSPAISASASSFEAAQERPLIPENQQYIVIVGDAVNAIVAGKEAKIVLDEANNKIYELMQDAGYYE